MSFKTSKALYRLFNGVFLALNCRILNNLFCVAAKGLYVRFVGFHVELRSIIKSSLSFYECIIYSFREVTGRKCLILLNIPVYFTSFWLSSFVWVWNVRLRSKITPSYVVFSLYFSTFVPIFNPLSKFGGKFLFFGLKIQQLDF